MSKSMFADPAHTQVERALAEIRAGRMIIVVDDEDRENEGDFVMAADKVTPSSLNFMAVHGRGLICLTLTGERVQQLALPMMVARNRARHSTAFTVSIGARRNETKGISASDRVRTILTAIDPAAAPSDLVMPGHVFPLRAVAGGVLARPGHTEASVDLARLAGCSPAGVICEVMNDDGTMARMPDLERFAARYDIHLTSIAALISYRLEQESRQGAMTQC
jgi:3,4-dihydroxy 2-butanone 4-phosphate synthase/GTP cyclohydrolase II